VQFRIKIEISNISIIEHFFTRGFSTCQLRNLSIVNLKDNHFFDALSTEIVLTPRHEKILGAKLISCTDPTCMLLFIELPPVSRLCHAQVIRCSHRIFEFKWDQVFSVAVFLNIVTESLVFIILVDELILQVNSYLIQYRHVFRPFFIYFLYHNFLKIVEISIKWVQLNDQRALLARIRLWKCHKQLYRWQSSNIDIIFHDFIDEFVFYQILIEMRYDRKFNQKLYAHFFEFVKTQSLSQ
jgi:hypothetical protein